MKQLLTYCCFFTAGAAIWLGIMECILKHSGYVGRSIVDACIVVQSLATVVFLLVSRRSASRFAVTGGAAAIFLLGGSALFKILEAAHFEGFVLFIGSALLVQSGLTVAALLRTDDNQPA